MRLCRMQMRRIIRNKYRIMKSTKKTKKEPKFIVNYTNIERPEDVYTEYILAKVRAGIAIDMEEAKMLVKFGAVLTMEVIDNYIELFEKTCVTTIEDEKVAEDLLNILVKATQKKQPWYKRLWNWIKKPFCKKK